MDPTEYDERHYVTPRMHRGPLYIPPRHPTPLEWCIAAATIALGIGLAWWCW